MAVMMSYKLNALCPPCTSMGFTIMRKAIGMLHRDLESLFRCLLPWQQGLCLFRRTVHTTNMADLFNSWLQYQIGQSGGGRVTVWGGVTPPDRSKPIPHFKTLVVMNLLHMAGRNRPMQRKQEQHTRIRNNGQHWHKKTQYGLDTY